MNKVLVLLFHLFWLTHPGVIDSATEPPRDPFSKAYALFEQGKLTEAEPLFRKSLDQKTILEDYNLYFLGVISFSQDSFDQARDYFGRLKNDFPRSVWLHDTNFHLAKISLKEGAPHQAIGLLTSLGSRRVGEPLFTEALYLLGQTYEKQGDPKRAFESYQRLRATFPLSAWAGKAKKEARKLREQFPVLLGAEKPGPLLKEAEILLGELDYSEAEKIYRALPGLDAKKSVQFSSLNGLAEVYRRARKRDQEKEVLNQIVREFPQTPEAADAFYRIAEIFWNQGKNREALTGFNQLRERYPESPDIDHAEFARGRIYESLKIPSEAIQIYRNFSKNFPRSRWGAQATWRMAWIHYLAADYDEAHAAFKRIATGIYPEHYRTGARFWQARTAEQLGNQEEAKGLYRQILSRTGDSYYKKPSRNALRRLGEVIEKRKPVDGQTLPNPTVPSNQNLSFHLARAQKLSDLSHQRFAVAELDRVRDQTGKDSSLRIMLMQQYARNQGYDRSVALAIQFGNSSEEFRRYRYPLAYWEIIKKEAAERGLDPYLILALIRQESLFDPDAISPASALGLMQLLPSTAGREAANMGLLYPGPEKLFEPDLNLRLGIHHLQRLVEIYPNSLAKALAAYNAGRRPVNRWKKRFASLDEEEFIERIPYRETRGYVKLVLRNYWTYKELYDNQP
ncbi:MAG: tetratricopeptide repeat protein [Deltaproteobacteria bacterium]|nr:tetratricopeptide repeat protein [Deltaproteobacteria bacterium]